MIFLSVENRRGRIQQYDSSDGNLVFGIVIKFTSMLVGDDVVVVEIIVV